MRHLLLLCVLTSASCLDSVSDNDMSANVDMTVVRDLANLDLTGALNCLALNQCTSACKNLMCVAACRDRATPAAQAKELDLQRCFNQYCPQESDMASPICALDGMGNRSAACVQCIANTQKTSASDCTPPGSAECTKCYNAAQLCKADP